MLFAFIFLAWVIFINNEKIIDIPFKVGGVITLLGFGFTLFQFGYNNISTNKRRVFDLRYIAYKEVMPLIDAVGESLNEVMSSKKLLEVYGLLGKVTNQANKIGFTINEYDSFLFQGILSTKESIQINNMLKSIMVRCDNYKVNVSDAIRMGNVDNNNFLDTITARSFQDAVNGYLLELHKMKYDLYDKLREYLK